MLWNIKKYIFLMFVSKSLAALEAQKQTENMKFIANERKNTKHQTVVVRMRSDGQSHLETSSSEPEQHVQHAGQCWSLHENQLDLETLAQSRTSQVHRCTKTFSPPLHKVLTSTGFLRTVNSLFKAGSNTEEERQAATAS